MRRLPDWVRDAVFYEIFPDRFRRGRSAWDVPPSLPGDRTPRNGNLDGIRAAIPHLCDLGVNAVYLTPIFHAGSYHKYDTLDYFAIDPAFGDEETFHRLVEDLHRANIRVVLDGVFNHCSDRHPFFLDAVERRSASAYWRWFTVRGDGIIVDPEPNYACWAGVAKMPEWNHARPEVVEYLLSVVRYWIREHAIDGWRLDTTDYLPPDFVRAIYRAAREQTPDVYVLGEVMGLGTPWFKHEAVDGVMHYKLLEALTRFFADECCDAAALAHTIYVNWHSYPEDGNYGSYTLLSSHDRPRFLTACGGDVRRFLLALVFQMTFPGAPAIYYGDEVGLEGGDDPDNRRCFPWHVEDWNLEILETARSLVRLRRSSSALRRGSLKFIHAEGRALGFERRLDEEAIYVALNASRGDGAVCKLPGGGWRDASGTDEKRDHISLGPLSYRILRRA